MNNKQLEMKVDEIKKSGQKTCCDCLHCKVSATSTKNNILCFCKVSKNQLRYNETYWLALKKMCKKFEDMSV